MKIGDLKVRIALDMHRADLGAKMNDFVADAYAAVNLRFATAFVVGADVDDLPAPYYLFYWAAMRAANEYIRNGPEVEYCQWSFDAMSDGQNVTGGDSSVNPNPEGSPPVITGSVPL